MGYYQLTPTVLKRGSLSLSSSPFLPTRPR